MISMGLALVHFQKYWLLSMYLLTYKSNQVQRTSIFNQIYLSTPKRIQDRSIVSLITPKFDNQFLLVMFFVCIANMKLFLL